MDGGARDLEIEQTRARRATGGPWAVALNETASTDEIKVTLLALAVVDDVIRVSGVVRVVRRPDVRLSNIPTLTLATLDGAPLGLIGAHALPSGRTVWVSWIFERPADVSTGYEGRIDHIDLAYRAGGVVRTALPGPWDFTFNVPNGRGTGSRAHRGDSIAEA